MPSFRRSGRTPSGTKSPADAPDTTCPFLARTMAASKTHICLSGEEPLATSRRYVDSYCVTADHARCSLFLAAYRASREVRVPEPAVGVMRIDAMIDHSIVPTQVDVSQPAPDAFSTLAERMPAEEQKTIPSLLTVDAPEPALAAASIAMAESDNESTERATATLPEVDSSSVRDDEPASISAGNGQERTPTLPHRAQAVALADSLAGVAQTLQSRALAQAAALTSLNDQVQAAESQGDASALVAELTSRMRSTLSDSTLESAAATVQKVRDNSNSLMAYMGITQNAQTLADMVGTLLEFRAAMTLSDTPSDGQ